MTIDEFMDNFYDGKSTFSGVDLSGQNLEGIRLTDLDFSRVNLDGAFLEGVNLTKANLHKVELDGANFTGTDFDRATPPYWMAR